jgi:integrase
MRAIIAATLLNSKKAQPTDKPFEIYDTRLLGFTLRVQPSGIRSYYARHGRSGRVALGKVGQYTTEEARDRCEKVLGNLAHGRPALQGLTGDEGVTLGDFIKDTYAPWAKAHRPRTAVQTLDRIKLHFSTWYTTALTAITLSDVEGWRIERINDGLTPSTVRRDLDTLSSVMTRAHKLRLVPENVVRQVERPNLDRTAKVRFLSKEEESRLRDALTKRDQRLREARASANAWRRERNKELLPPLTRYGDHLTPAVLLSMNTGMRRGELLALRWANVDLKAKQITIEGVTAKNAQARHIPLNTEAVKVLKNSRAQNPADERVIPIDTAFQSSWTTVLTRAAITSLRWHDLRHHFASRLAQKGVPLNTVRELLGHASMAMTLRYAHLAPDQKREAVAKLGSA